MSTHGTHSAQEMIDVIKVARDRILIQAHLFSLEARKRWSGLETRLFELESKLEESGEKFADSVTANFRDATQAAKELMRELRRCCRGSPRIGAEHGSCSCGKVTCSRQGPNSLLHFRISCGSTSCFRASRSGFSADNSCSTRSATRGDATYGVMALTAASPRAYCYSIVWDEPEKQFRPPCIAICAS
jgi:hypothetical protein